MTKNNILKENKTRVTTKNENKSDSKFSIIGFFKRIDNRKFKNIVGLAFLFFAILSFIAFLSYVFTWKEDQSIINDVSLWKLLFNESAPVTNWLGKIGAWIGYFFIFNGFGISSIGISFISFILGVKLFFNFRILPIKKSIITAFVAIIWTSIFFSFFASNHSVFGGTFGFYCNNWLVDSLGYIGTFLFDLLLLLLAIIMLFNPDFQSLFEKISTKFQSIFKRNEISNGSQNTIVTNENENENELELETSSDHDPLEIEFDDPTEENLNEESDSDELPMQEELLTDEKNDFNNTSGDEDFSIEIAPEEHILSEEIINEKVEEFGEYDPKLDLSSYTLPPIDLLQKFESTKTGVDKEELERNKNNIVETLSNYKIEIDKIKATIGPTVTLYEIIPSPGVRISKIKNLEDDIALSLAALGIRIIAPIPGKGTIGIEVPNSKPEVVSMRSLISSEKFQNSEAELPIVLGKTITNETYTFDLTKAPHLLVAGATGQGKSVGLNAILVSLLYKKHPAQVKFVLVDPKKVELTLYNKIERHFLAKLPGEEESIITDTSKVVNTLNSLCIEMDDRYELLKEAQVRNIKEYNQKFIKRKLNPEKGHRYLPYIVVLIDEFADLIMTAGKEVEHPIARIAQLARAIGIHLIVATQRPSVNVITGMIKANFPQRIAFRVLSKIDSRTILDASGADQLIGKGDMLISTGNDMIRLQCGFVDTPEVEDICNFIGEQRGYPDALLLPEYVGESTGTDFDSDDLNELDNNFVEAAKIVVIHQQGSASLLQRKLKLGYNRAGRLVDQLEAHGIIGPFKGSKPREVLFHDELSLNDHLNQKGIG